MTYFNRSDWGATAHRSTSAWASGMPNSVTLHSVGATVGVRDDYRTSVRSIQRHAIDKGLSDIDYNFLVDLHGNVYEGRGWSVQSGAQHVGNRSSLAICYIDYGDGDVPFTDAAKRAIKRLAAGRPIHPHNFWNNSGNYDTSCPGSEITQWCNAGAPPPAGEEEDDMTDQEKKLLFGILADLTDKVNWLIAGEIEGGWTKRAPSTLRTPKIQKKVGA